MKKIKVNNTRFKNLKMEYQEILSQTFSKIVKTRFSNLTKTNIKTEYISKVMT